MLIDNNYYGLACFRYDEAAYKRLNSKCCHPCKRGFCSGMGGNNIIMCDKISMRIPNTSKRTKWKEENSLKTLKKTRFTVLYFSTKDGVKKVELGFVFSVSHELSCRSSTTTTTDDIIII